MAIKLKDVSREEHLDFYRYLASAFDEPMFTLHFHAASPIPLHALFYVPERHTEKLGTFPSPS